MLERNRPAPVGTLWVDMPHVHPDVEPLGTVQDDDPEPPRASTAERHYELKWGRERTAGGGGRYPRLEKDVDDAEERELRRLEGR